MPHSIFSVRKLLLALLVGILATSLSGRIFAEKVVEAVTNMPIENAFVVRHWMGHRPEHTYCASTSFAVTDARGKFSMPTSVYRMFNQEQHLYVYKPGYRELYLVGMQRSGSSAQEPDPSITPLSKQDYLKAVDAQADSMRGNIVMAKDISSASKRLSYLADRARLGACTGSGEEQLELVPFYSALVDEAATLAVTSDERYTVKEICLGLAYAATITAKDTLTSSDKSDAINDRYLRKSQPKCLPFLDAQPRPIVCVGCALPSPEFPNRSDRPPKAAVHGNQTGSSAPSVSE